MSIFYNLVKIRERKIRDFDHMRCIKDRNRKGPNC